MPKTRFLVPKLTLNVTRHSRPRKRSDVRPDNNRFREQSGHQNEIVSRRRMTLLRRGDRGSTEPSIMKSTGQASPAPEIYPHSPFRPQLARALHLEPGFAHLGVSGKLGWRALEDHPAVATVPRCACMVMVSFCSTRRMEMRRSAILCSRSAMRSTICGASPSVGSSIMMRSGSPIRVRQIVGILPFAAGDHAGRRFRALLEFGNSR